MSNVDFRGSAALPPDAHAEHALAWAAFCVGSVVRLVTDAGPFDARCCAQWHLNAQSSWVDAIRRLIDIEKADARARDQMEAMYG